ncbi:hypothetical protein PVT67_07175 [Gallaecimonas kandeliae]|uniref:hypothetical protein n=1 Tax=Gallaecimonas kandeliae TaxID=3029055 RepID=UPI002648178A|nr:hypothetical protein [Gallaecimonas kandeliae]WKE67012.1 hypothetical protein PVT67_07175 [Gallaecimonas kandeliae]
MSNVNWNNGQLITLEQGMTATCNGNLNPGQLYCLFFYNAAQNDADTTVSVVWSNSQPPVLVKVPGTTGRQGLASICFVNGDQTNTVSAAVTGGQPGASIQAFIGSVKMPIDTSGINNKELPANGQPQPLKAFTRYYDVPASHWYQAQVQSDIDQFIFVQMQEQKAVVNIVNKLVDPSNIIAYAGDAQQYVTINSSDYQLLSWSLQGNGRQFVWINADSVQNSQNATISLQSLSSLYAAQMGNNS